MHLPAAFSLTVLGVVFVERTSPVLPRIPDVPLIEGPLHSIPSQSCSASVDKLVGYGHGTNGGGSSEGIPVNSCIPWL